MERIAWLQTDLPGLRPLHTIPRPRNPDSGHPEPSGRAESSALGTDEAPERYIAGPALSATVPIAPAGRRYGSASDPAMRLLRALPSRASHVPHPAPGRTAGYFPPSTPRRWR